jgi:hypothetical protein
MAMLAMTILVHFWLLYGAIGPSTLTPMSNLRHCTYYASQQLSVDREWRVLCALAVHKPAHGHGHGHYHYHAHGGPDFCFRHRGHTSHKVHC